MKHYKWKTIRLGNSDAFHHIKAAWGSSYEAFGKGKIMNFDSWLEVETNLSIRDIRLLFRHAGVSLPKDILYDTMTAAEREAEELSREEC